MSILLWAVVACVLFLLAVVAAFLARENCCATTVAVASRTSDRVSKLSEIRSGRPLEETLEMGEMGADDRVQLSLPPASRSLRSQHSSFFRLREEEVALGNEEVAPVNDTQEETFEEEEEMAADLWVSMDEPKAERRLSEHIEYNDDWEPVAVVLTGSSAATAAVAAEDEDRSSEAPPASLVQLEEDISAPAESPPLESLARTAGAAGRRPASRRHGPLSATEPTDKAATAGGAAGAVAAAAPVVPVAPLGAEVASGALPVASPPAASGGTFALELNRAVTAKALRNRGAEQVVESEAAPPPPPPLPTTWTPRTPSSACAPPVAPLRSPLPLTPASGSAAAGSVAGAAGATFAELLESAVAARLSGRSVDFAERLEAEVASRSSNRSASSSFAGELAHQVRVR